MDSVKLEPVRVKLYRAANEKTFPNEYICNFLEPGLVSYEDSGGGMTYLTKETILKIMPSFKGKPMIEEVHRDITPKNFKRHAVGYVTEVWWDEATQWAYAKFLVTDDTTRELIQKGYSVSCAFKVTRTGPGGEWHAIKYDEEILDGEAEHIAIVDDPRYEGCRIVENSKGRGLIQGAEHFKNKGDTTMFGFFKKAKNSKEKAKIDLSKTTVEIGEKKISLKDMISIHNSRAAAAEELTADSMIVAEDGTEYRFGDLEESYRLENAKKDEGESEEKKENASDDDEDGEMEADGAKKKAKKKNGTKKKMNASDEDDDDEDGKKENAVGDGDEEGDNPETTIKRNTKTPQAVPGKSFRVLNQARARSIDEGSEAGEMILPTDKMALGALYY